MALKIEAQFLDKASPNIKKLDRNLANIDKQTISTSKNFLGLNANLVKLAGGFVAVGSVIRGATYFVKQADQLTLLQDKLALVTDSVTELAEVQRELFNISQNSRVALASTTDLYTRLERSTKGLNVSNKELLDVTKTINQTLLISGASAQSAQASLFQLGQGLGAGALRGEELNSVLEQTPRLAQAIAEGLGLGIGQLRKFASEGKLTSETVLQALKNQGVLVNEEFSNISLNVGQALVQVGNSTDNFISTFNRATSATKNLASSFSGLTDTIDKLSEFMESKTDPKLLNDVQVLQRLAKEAGEQWRDAEKIISGSYENIFSLFESKDLAKASQLEAEKQLTAINDRIKELNSLKEKSQQAKLEIINIENAKKTEDLLRNARALIDPYAGKIESINVKYKQQLQFLEKTNATEEQINTVLRAKQTELKKINDLIEKNKDVNLGMNIEQDAQVKAFEKWEQQQEDAKSFYQQLKDLNKSQSQLELENLARDYDLYGANLDKKSLAYENFVNRVNELGEQMYQEQLQKSDNTFAGIQAGLKSLTDDMQSDFQIASRVTINAIDGMSSELAKFVTTGKADFGSLAQSIIQDLIKIQIQKQLTGIFSNVIGSIGGSLFGGTTFSASSSAGATGFGASYGANLWTGGQVPEYAQGGQVLSFGNGGYTGDGGKYEPKGVVHGGEYVITKEQTQKIGVQNIERFANGYANGGYVGNMSRGSSPKVSVVVHNNGSSEISPDMITESTRTDERGEQEKVINIVIDGVDRNVNNIRDMLKGL